MLNQRGCKKSIPFFTASLGMKNVTITEDTKMKKILAIIITIVFSLSCVSVYAQDSIAVLLDGQALSFDVEPQIINSRTMVPMRAIFTALGANVDWIEEHRLILASKNTSLIAMMIDSPIMHIGNLETGEQRVTELDSPPVIVDSRTLVPVRAISDALGVEVGWDEATRSVILSTGQQNINEEINAHEK